MKTLAPEAVKIINNYAALAQYKRTPIFEKYITCPLKTTALFTGNQCLAGETEIYDPVLGKNRQVKDIDGDFHVLAWDGETLVPAAAMKPFMKPPEQLYRVSVEDGSSFISTGDHRILTRRGWDSVASLRQGSEVVNPEYAGSGHDPILINGITEDRFDSTYDFHVPVHNNYSAARVVHHNCGKTAMVIVSWVLRFLSMHPVASKNFNWLICNKKKNHRFSLLYRKPGMLCNYQGCEGKLEVHVSPFRKMRFASENLPFQSATTGPAHKGGMSIEVRNTQYPELIKWLPPYLIKKNISSHNTVMVIKDVWGLSDIIPEFVSYNQDVQAMAGVQLAGCAFDEEPPPAFFEEMQVRMLATDGTVDIGLTPANRLTHMYDQIYTQAQVYYRSETICKELGLSPEERTDSRKSIAVFQAATDDNPTLDKKTIERVMTDLDTDGDPDKLMIRRYGVFKAVSTTIFRAFSYAVHYLPMEKWFPGGVPENWLHARSIDYHPVVPWAMIHISLSDTNEAFVWWEANPDPMRLVTDEIAMKLAQGAGDYRFKIDRIDPLANQKQSKRTRDEARTTSVTEDLNDQLRKLKARGIGAGGAFIGFETKSTRGREQIKLRLKNSVECKEPFDNKRQDEHGNQYFLPTLWIMDTCPAVAKSMKNWRLDDHADSGALITKDAKETPQQKWSHFPMTIEGILKEEGFRPPIVWERPDDRNRSSYFSEGRGERGALHARMR